MLLVFQVQQEAISFVEYFGNSPTSVVGSQKTPPCPPNDLTCLPVLVCVCVSVFWSPKIPKESYLSFWRWRWGWQALGLPLTWMRASRDPVTIRLFWAPKTAVSTVSSCSRSVAMNRWNPWESAKNIRTDLPKPATAGTRLRLLFLEELKSNSIQSTEIFFWAPTMCQWKEYSGEQDRRGPHPHRAYHWGMGMMVINKLPEKQSSYLLSQHWVFRVLGLPVWAAHSIPEPSTELDTE